MTDVCYVLNKILLTFWVICQKHRIKFSDSFVFRFITYLFITVYPKYLTDYNMRKTEECEMIPHSLHRCVHVFE